MSTVVDITLRADLAEIPRLSERIETLAEDHGWPMAATHHINLVLDELLTNTISYGWDEAGSHTIALHLTIDADQVTIEMRDDARPFDPLAQDPPDLDADIDDREIGGLGIHFVKSFMDRVSYRHDGRHNILILEKSLTGSND